MLGRESGQASLAEVQLWSGKQTPLIEPGACHDPFAQLRPVLPRDDDVAHWYKEGKGTRGGQPARGGQVHLDGGGAPNEGQRG
jgi:hypothetical protein